MSINEISASFNIISQLQILLIIINTTVGLLKLKIPPSCRTLNLKYTQQTLHCMELYLPSFWLIICI